MDGHIHLCYLLPELERPGKENSSILHFNKVSQSKSPKVNKGHWPLLVDQETTVAKGYVICSALQEKTVAGPKKSQHPAL